MISCSDFRKGLKIEVEGEVFEIIDFQHVKPGKGGAFVRTKLRSLAKGSVLEKTFRAGEKFPEPELGEKNLQFLYTRDKFFHFMDNETYEDVVLSEAEIGDAKDFLGEGMVLKGLFFKGKLLNVELPIFVELKIVNTDPGIKGDTASGGSKPATVETGARINIPLFVQEGDRVRIDTRTREYIERIP